MKLGIMQPYLFPYIGYFQLLNTVDQFVIHDDVQWIKGGWINRNRILVNNTDKMITISVSKRSNFDLINQFQIAPLPNNRKKFLQQISFAYQKSPQFASVFSLLSKIILNPEDNLSKYILFSLEEIKSFLDIKTPILISSKLSKTNGLKGQARVIDICKILKATTYINPIGGTELYDKDVFNKIGINLNFIKTKDFTYPQFNNAFIPYLSIIDVLMFNNPKTIRKLLLEYDLL